MFYQSLTALEEIAVILEIVLVKMLIKHRRVSTCVKQIYCRYYLYTTSQSRIGCTLTVCAGNYLYSYVQFGDFNLLSIMTYCQSKFSISIYFNYLVQCCRNSDNTILIQLVC